MEWLPAGFGLETESRCCLEEFTRQLFQNVYIPLLLSQLGTFLPKLGEQEMKKMQRGWMWYFQVKTLKELGLDSYSTCTKS